MITSTPYRKLQEEKKALEVISKAHQKQNGDLQVELTKTKSELADAQTVINLLKDRIETTEEPLRLLCRILKVTSFFDNARATQMKQARDIVDINYVA